MVLWLGLATRDKLLPASSRLQVKEFGEFEDILNDSESNEYLEYAPMALDLMIKMSLIYDDEGQRKSTLVSLLQGKFQVVNQNGPGYSTDLSIKSGAKVVANIELKNELGMGGKSPNLQNAGYFIHLIKGQCSHFPLLLISLVGCEYFQVFGAAWCDTVCIDPLMEPLSLLYVPNRTNTIEKVARVLSAVSIIVSKLGEWEPKGRAVHPYFDYDSKLCYQKKIKNQVWNAKLRDENSERPVVVKFVKNYGEKVHKLLSENGMAPTIRSIQKLPGGWIVVIMDEVQGERLSSNTLPQDAKESFRSFKNHLKYLLRSNHFVHGDLRPQNIIKSSNGNGDFQVVDFDWAGDNGIVKYPLDLNTDAGWAPQVHGGGSILHEHDEFQLQQCY